MVIQVFEHQTLKIGQHPNFTEKVWETLIRFNDTHQQPMRMII
jgi:hypothetical protein